MSQQQQQQQQRQEQRQREQLQQPPSQPEPSSEQGSLPLPAPAQLPFRRVVQSIPPSSPYAATNDLSTAATTIADPPIHTLSTICLTGIRSKTGARKIRRVSEEGEVFYGAIKYRIFRPEQLHGELPPLVIVHGGPGIPSSYLIPFIRVIPDRSVILYDQLGCGQSSRPTDPAFYSIKAAAKELQELIEDEWRIKRYHLYGHSFGGILAFEALKMKHDNLQRMHPMGRDNFRCMSVILAGTSSSTELVMEEAKRFGEIIREELRGKHRKNRVADHFESAVQETFKRRHECRVVPTPMALQDAYSQAATVWWGAGAISDYEAEADFKLPYSVLILRGESDFVTKKCVVGWDKLWKHPHRVVLAGTGHHGLLENEDLYGDVVRSFIENNER